MAVLKLSVSWCRPAASCADAAVIALESLTTIACRALNAADGVPHTRWESVATGGPYGAWPAIVARPRAAGWGREVQLPLLAK